MDQDEFRKLLTGARPSSKFQTGFAIALPPRRKLQVSTSSSPGFQPRKLDQKRQRPSAYRDRAAERRAGTEHDPVDTLVENSDSKDAVSEDGRTIEIPPLKGLDIAEIERSKSHTSTVEEDETLETVFQESRTKLDASDGTSKKRTRDDLIRALKEQRASSNISKDPSSDSAFEKAKQLGKFKPIGASGISSKTKVKHRGEDGVTKPKKKKQRARSPASGTKEIESKPTTHEMAQTETKTNFVNAPSDSLSHSAGDEDIDIFGDVEEYKGVNLDEEEENEDIVDDEEGAISNEENAHTQKNSWFKHDEHDDLAAVSAEANMLQSPLSGDRSLQPPTPSPPPEQGASESTSTAPTRLQPLSSSSMPSIRDFLDVEKIAGAYEKRQARKKTKRDNKEKGDQSEKVNRDYQKLNSYLKSKGG